MAWNTLTLDDVKHYVSGSEYAGVTPAALASGQDADTVVEGIIADVVQEVRGYVKACAVNTLGAGSTIPDELRSAALAVIRARIFTRLPGMAALNDEQRQSETRSAELRIRDAGKCLIAIEAPETASEQVIASPQVTVITRPVRTASRDAMKGLL